MNATDWWEIPVRLFQSTRFTTLSSEMHDSVVKIFNFTSKPMQFLSFDVLNQKTKKKLQAIYKKTYN